MADVRARLKKLEDKARRQVRRSFIRDGFRFVGGAVSRAGLLKVPVMNQEQWEAAAQAETERIVLKRAAEAEADTIFC